MTRVIVMFGSALGSGAPVYLAQLCGIDLGFEEGPEIKQLDSD